MQCHLMRRRSIVSPHIFNSWQIPPPLASAAARSSCCQAYPEGLPPSFTSPSAPASHAKLQNPPSPPTHQAENAPFKTSSGCARLRFLNDSLSPCISSQCVTWPDARLIRAMHSVCQMLPHSSPSITSSLHGRA